MSSLLSNFDIAQQALQTSLNSSGSAMREHDRWSQSLEAKLNKLKATWQSLSQSFMSSNFLKVALDGVIALVDGIDSLISTFGTIPTLLTAFATFKSFTGDGIFKTVIDEADSTSKKMTNIFSEAARQSRIALENIGFKRNSDFKASLDADIDALNNWYDELAKGPPREDAFSNIFKNASEAAKQYVESGKLATEGLNGFIKSQQQAQVSTLAQNKSLANASTIIKEYFSGCQNVGLSQKDFADAVSKTNPKLAEQLNSAKSAKGALAGYAASLVGATIKTIALEAATALLNAAISMGVSFLISAAISAITKWINAEKELSEEVQKLTSEYKEQHDALKKISGDYDTSNEKSMISRYEKLSKGVSDFGDNISLTADEYSEYQGIVNKIAEQMPKLVSGYDSQGNAILSCKGNVEELTTAYEDLIAAQNREILNRAGDIEEDFENKRKDAKSNTDGFFGVKISSDRAKDYKEILDGAKNGIEDTDAALDNLFDRLDGIDKDGNINSWENSNYATDIQALSEALETADFERSGYWFNKESQENHIKRAFKEDKDTVKKILDEYYADLEAEVEQSRSIAQAVLSDAFDISTSEHFGISDTLKNVAEQVVNSLDYDFFDKLKEQGKSVKNWTNEMLDQLDSINSSNIKTIETGFDLKTQFNGGDISYGQYVDGLKNVESTIDKLDLKDEVKEQLKLSLNLDENGIVNQYEKYINRLKSETVGFTQETAKSFLSSLSADELSVFLDILPKIEASEAKESVGEIQAMIEKEMAMRGLSIDLDIDIEKEKLENLASALTESVSGVGLSNQGISIVESMFGNLDSYDQSKLFERTANGIRLNSQELSRLNDEYARQNINDINNEMDVLGNAYNQTREELYGLTYGTEEYNDKLSDLEDIEGKIKALERLGAQYEGLASSYNQWQMAESAGSQRDMYESIIEGFENVENEISRGWYDEGTIEFLELLTGKELSTASISKIKEAWKSVGETIEGTKYSVKDFFTTNEDGESTNTGVYNFLRAVEDVTGNNDVIKKKDGKIIGFDFNVVGGDKAIAEALGISEELVQIMLRAADDAGFVISMDGSYQQLDVLKEKAQEAAVSMNKALKNAGKETIDIDMNASSVDDIKSQLDSIFKTYSKDGVSIDTSMPGGEEALSIASTLTSMLDKLSEPTYMDIEINQVEDDVQEPLSKLQELVRLTQTEHQVKLRGGDTSALEKSKKEIYDYFENLDPEIKTKIGLVDDSGNPLTGDALKKKIDSGELTIDATVDIQLKMDEKLDILVAKAMLDAGLITEEEFEKKVNVYLDVEEVNTEDVEKKTEEAVNNESGEPSVVQKPVTVETYTDTVDTSNTENEVEKAKEKIRERFSKEIKMPYSEQTLEVAVDFLANTEEIDDYTPEQLNAIVKYIVETDDIESYTPEQKQALVTFFANTTEPDSYTPEQKQAIVDYLAGKKSIDEYNPEDKKAVVKFLDDSTLPDSYQPDPKTGYVTFSVNKGSPVYTWEAPLVYGDAAYTPYLSSTSLPAITGLTAYYTPAWEGRGPAAGTAHAGGSTGGRAFARGNWGLKDNGVALGGELGQELVVRDGKFFTIGDEGAQFFRYRKNDIVFNAAQTESLFKYGGIKGANPRGKMLATGTAFAQGKAFSTGSGGDTEIVVGTNSVTGKVYTKSKDSDSKNESQEVLDWIETKLSRIQRAINKLDQKANNIYKKWSTRNKALTQEIDKVRDEIELQQKAYDKYMAAAEGVGLSSSYSSKVRNGEIDIETINDEVLKEKISDYENWYNKALECKDAIEELKITESELYKQRFDNVASEYDGILGVIEHEKNMLEEYISQSEAQAWLVSSQYYKALANNERDNITQLRKEQASLLSAFEDAKNSGAVEKNSEGWYEYVNAIDEVTFAITESETALKEYAQTIQQLKFEQFDLLQDKISSITEETEFLIELMSNKKLYDDKGQLTEEGKSTLGLRGVSYNVNMAQADKYGQEAARLKKELSKDPYDTELEERYREMIKLQQEYILNAEQEKEAIRDLVSDGIEAEISALEELIDKKNEELNAERNLYEYSKKVMEMNEEISSLEKQRESYLGDDSEEGRLKLQQIEVALGDAKEELAETENDKLIEDTEKLLDNLLLEYQDTLNNRLDNLDSLVSDMITEINSDAIIIGDTIRETASDVGYTLSDSMKTIWDSNTTNTNNVITSYGEKFTSAQTTTNNALSTINTNLQNIITQVNKLAKTNVKSASTSSAANSSQANTSKKEPTTTDKKPTTSTTTTTTKEIKVGGKINAGNAQIYDYAGDKSGERQYYRNDPIYKVLDEKNGYILTRWHKLSSGYTGWFKKSDVKAYATGKRNLLDDELAWTQEKGREMIVRPSDGAILTPVAKGDSVLNATATGNIWNMANNPAEFIKNNLNLGSSGVPNNSSTQNSYSQTIENVTFRMDNVKNYDEMLNALKSDRRFEKLVSAMTIDRINGGSSLAKNKSIR